MSTTEDIHNDALTQRRDDVSYRKQNFRPTRRQLEIIDFHTCGTERESAVHLIYRLSGPRRRGRTLFWRTIGVAAVSRVGGGGGHPFRARQSSSTDAVAASVAAAVTVVVAVGVKLPRWWPRENGFGLAAASDFAIGQTRLSMQPGVHTAAGGTCRSVLRASRFAWSVTKVENIGQ